MTFTPRHLLLAASGLALLCNSCEMTRTSFDAPGWTTRDRTVARDSDQRERMFWNGFRIEADTLTPGGASGRVKIRFPNHASVSAATANEVRMARNDEGRPVLVLDGAPILDGQRGRLDLVRGSDNASIAVTPDLRFHVHGAARYGRGRL